MNYKETFLMDEFKNIGIELSNHQVNQFIQYYELLIEWNKVMNLTSIVDFEEVCKKHFIDSVSIINVKSDIENKMKFDFNNNEAKIIDIGTGAGFPGIPIKIVYPSFYVTLLDSLSKRIDFLNVVIENLNLENIEAIHGRAEDFAKDSNYRNQYDLSISRAVSSLSVLCEYSLPYLKLNGLFVSYKSEKVNDELNNIENALKTLNGSIMIEKDFNLYNMYRKIVIIEKIDLTPGKYPRKAGIPNKKPL